MENVHLKEGKVDADNIKICLRKICCEDWRWVILPQNRVQCPEDLDLLVLLQVLIHHRFCKPLCVARRQVPAPRFVSGILQGVSGTCCHL
jgi:hypothetical protein